VSRSSALRSPTFDLYALLPLVVLLVVLSIYPIAQLVGMSFFEITVRAGQRSWVWNNFANYVRLATDATYWSAVWNTVVYVVSSMIIEVVIGLSLAIATTRIRRGAVVYRTILMLPLLVPPISVATSWRLIYNANFGLLNRIFAEIGVTPQYWLSTPGVALRAVIAVSIWYWAAYSFILLLAGLQNIPGELYESAQIDGASAWQQFWGITLPLLKPALFVTIMLRGINAFKVFDIVYALTGGGPGISTEVINTHVYKVFIAQQRLGYGAALAVGAILMVAVLSFVHAKVSGLSREQATV